MSNWDGCLTDNITVKSGWLTRDDDVKCGIWFERTGGIHRRIINFEEQQTRAALIALGWTPPRDA